MLVEALVQDYKMIPATPLKREDLARALRGAVIEAGLGRKPRGEVLTSCVRSSLLDAFYSKYDRTAQLSRTHLSG